MTNDPIADFLIRLKNANAARRTHASVPYSAMKLALAELLKREGYVGDVERVQSGALKISLLYGAKGRPSVSGSKRISKPSRRVYLGAQDIHPVKNNHGLLVLSTPSGILSGKEAHAQKVGGEALFEIW